MMKSVGKNVDAYLAAQPKAVKVLLEKLRKTIKAAAPDAEEEISYQMPAYKLHGPLVYFAAYDHHIGFYPTSTGISKFVKEFKDYKYSKGAVQFPLDKALPYALITKIVKYKVEENRLRASLKTGSKKAAAAPGEKSDPKSVTEHINKLSPEVKKLVTELRKKILSADKTIGERIKWNNPSFFYTGAMKPFDPKEYKRDMAVCNLHKGRVMVVFPSGAKVQDKSGLLQGDYKDGRRTVVFEDLKDLKTKEKDLLAVIKKWIKLINT